MPHLFILLLKINLVLLLFAATYYLVLRRLTFYVLNRCFLVFGIIFSTAYPFIDLTDFFQQQAASNIAVTYLPQLNQQASALVPTGFFINNWPVFSALFYFGVVLMTLRLTTQFISLYKIHRRSNASTVANYKVRTLNESVSPFSFWQTIYLNPTLHNENELETILAHETVHVKQWHTVDIILAELSVVFYWFNPGVWLMKRAVRENLEFITDQKILKKGVDKKSYQYSLLGVGQLNTSVAIVNNFNLSDLKKRIKMMNVKRSSKLTLTRYAFALPVLLLTTLAFTVSKKDVKAHLPQLSKIIPQLTVAEQLPLQTSVVRKAKKQKFVNRNIRPKIEIKDTISRINYFVNTIFIKRDSNATGRLTASQLQEIMKEKSLQPGNRKLIVNSSINQIFVYKKDSLSTESVGEAIRMSTTFGAKTKFDKDQTATPENGKVVMIRAFKVSDTTLGAHKVEYLVNGMVYNAKDINKLNANEIERVQVLKGTDGTKSQIHIELKKKADL